MRDSLIARKESETETVLPTVTCVMSRRPICCTSKLGGYSRKITFFQRFRNSRSATDFEQYFSIRRQYYYDITKRVTNHRAGYYNWVLFRVRNVNTLPGKLYESAGERGENATVGERGSGDRLSFGSKTVAKTVV